MKTKSISRKQENQQQPRISNHKKSNTEPVVKTQKNCWNKKKFQTKRRGKNLSKPRAMIPC